MAAKMSGRQEEPVVMACRETERGEVGQGVFKGEPAGGCFGSHWREAQRTQDKGGPPGWRHGSLTASPPVR